MPLVKLTTSHKSRFRCSGKVSINDGDESSKLNVEMMIIFGVDDQKVKCLGAAVSMSDTPFDRKTLVWSDLEGHQQK